MGASAESVPGGNGLGVRFEAVEKRFGSLAALRGISLEVQPGEFVVLLGPNGAGKTTLLRLAALLSSPTRGRVHFLRRSQPENAAAAVAPDQARRAIGIVSHSTLLYEDLTAAENLAFFAQLYGLSQIAELVKNALERCGLGERGPSLVRTLSRGMRQRLAIARALLASPGLLLLDEPATGLDPHGQEWLGEILAGTRAEGCTAIVSTHTHFSALALATRALSLEAGRILRDSGRGGDPALALTALPGRTKVSA